jgi:hypothetical protein
MEPILFFDSELGENGDEEERSIRVWREEQLRSLGVAPRAAAIFASLVDWHEIAALVARGCSPELALEIAR